MPAGRVARSRAGGAGTAARGAARGRAARSEGEPLSGEDPAGPRGDLLEEAETLIETLRRHPDSEVGRGLERLLEGIDAVHRSGLTALVTAIRSMAGEAFLNRVIGDPAIRLLLVSYDLVPADRRLLAEEALDAARGPLHDEGVDVELREVLGGVVRVRLHGRTGVAPEPEAVRPRLEAALREALPGFQELDVDAGGGLTSHVPLSRLRAPKAVFSAAASSDALGDGTLHGVELHGEPVLLARVGETLFAVRNRCGASPLPLHFGRLDGETVVCPWHGCRYDLRSGRRLDADAPPLRVHAVREADGDVQVSLPAAGG